MKKTLENLVKGIKNFSRKLAFAGALLGGAYSTQAYSAEAPKSTWEYSYQTENGTISEIKEASDGSYIATGSHNGGWKQGIYLLKVNKNGRTELFEHYYGDQGNSLAETADGYVLTGSLNENGKGNLLVVGTDFAGKEKWRKVYREASDGTKVIRTSDGNLLVFGQIPDSVSALDAYLIKMDKDKNDIFKKIIGEKGWEDFCFDGIETSDRGYVFSGAHGSFNLQKFQGNLTKTDSNGEVLWTRVYEESPGIGHYFISETSDKGIIQAGTRNGEYIFLTKTDSNGDVQWSRDFNELLGNAFSVKETKDKGLAVSGIFYKNPPDGEAVLLRTDEQGTPLWVKTYGSKTKETFWSSANSLIVINDGFVFGGNCYFGKPYQKLYIVKTDTDGDVPPHFKRGDANLDERLNIADAISVLGHIYNNKKIKCSDAADANDNGKIETADAISILSRIFNKGPWLPFPNITPSFDPTEDDLTCGE